MAEFLDCTDSYQTRSGASVYSHDQITCYLLAWRWRGQVVRGDALCAH